MVLRLYVYHTLSNYILVGHRLDPYSSTLCTSHNKLWYKGWSRRRWQFLMAVLFWPSQIWWQKVKLPAWVFESGKGFRLQQIQILGLINSGQMFSRALIPEVMPKQKGNAQFGTPVENCIFCFVKVDHTSRLNNIGEIKCFAMT